MRRTLQMEKLRPGGYIDCSVCSLDRRVPLSSAITELVTLSLFQVPQPRGPAPHCALPISASLKSLGVSWGKCGAGILFAAWILTEAGRTCWVLTSHS